VEYKFWPIHHNSNTRTETHKEKKQICWLYQNAKLFIVTYQNRIFPIYKYSYLHFKISLHEIINVFAKDLKWIFCLVSSRENILSGNAWFVLIFTGRPEIQTEFPGGVISSSYIYIQTTEVKLDTEFSLVNFQMLSFRSMIDIWPKTRFSHCLDLSLTHMQCCTVWVNLNLPLVQFTYQPHFDQIPQEECYGVKLFVLRGEVVEVMQCTATWGPKAWPP
jgi:hypothetical protein